MEVDPIPNGNQSASTTEAAPSLPQSFPSPKLTQLTESLKLEHQFFRVPFEDYKKTIRANHRAVEKEFCSVIAAANYSPSSPDDAVQHLSSLVSRLHGLKRKLEEGNRAESLHVQRCRARFDHLAAADEDSSSEWCNIRLNRILVDYMLRLSYYDTGSNLAASCSIKDLVDVDVFQEARKVIDSLKKQDVAPALAWCSENKAKLKKSKSKLEFQLRLQEFVELVRNESYMPAILYSRKHLAPWSAMYATEFMRVFATLAFKKTTICSVYKTLFEEKQWETLVDHFKHEFCKLYGMTLEPLLHIYLQAGLSALKTPYCYEEECPKDDPLSHEGFRRLALPLPYSKQHHSKLVCYMSKDLMDHENPPQVLPNGYVYGKKALEEMAQKNNGKITCPRSGFVCSLSDVVRAYVS